MAQWVALGLMLAMLCSAIVLCYRRPSPRHQFIAGAVEHLAQCTSAAMETRDREVAGSSAVQRIA